MTVTVSQLGQYADDLTRLARTQVAKADLAKTILNGVPFDMPLAGDDLAAILGLLANHPQAAAKVGAGLERITVARALMGSRCFQIHRVDGTTTDFSYRKCLTTTSPKTAVTAACRLAVAAHMQIVKTEKLWATGQCEVTGMPVDDQNSHLHHAPPMFDQLVGQWVAQSGGFETVSDRLKREDNQHGETLSYDDRTSWLAYHDQNAVLQLVHKKANLAIEAARRGIQAG